MSRFIKLVFVSQLAFTFGFLGIASSANASLIGSRISLSFAISSIFVDVRAQNVVTADDTDALRGGGFVLDPNAEGFEFYLEGGSAMFLGPGSRLELGGMEWLGVDGEIIGFQIADNPEGINKLTFLQAIQFTESSIFIPLHSNGVSPGPILSVTFETVHRPIPGPDPVPEPATLTLFGLGLLGLGVARRRTKNAA